MPSGSVKAGYSSVRGAAAEGHTRQQGQGKAVAVTIMENPAAEPLQEHCSFY